MTGFRADWLALRNPADARARNRGLMAELAAHFAGRPPPRVLDLGAGTGATMGAMAPHLPKGQCWRLVDSDPELLSHAVPPDGAGMEPVPADLADAPEALFDPVPDLLTASALFDLAAAPWIDRIVTLAARHRVPVYAALSYDGRECWSPPHRLDAAALTAFHADQMTDKGLGGPALGPDAHAYLADRLDRAGYRVLTAPSDWELSAPRDSRLIAALAQGTGSAIRPFLGRETDLWLDARLAARSVRIGHRDLLALPA
jgi:hypothetical protein